MKENELIKDWSQVLTLNNNVKNINLETLKELSLINKYLRNKLSSKLFNTISLRGTDLFNYLNDPKISKSLKLSVMQYSNYLNSSEDGHYNLSKLKNLEVNSIISLLNSQLTAIKSQVTSFKLNNLNELGYFTLPLAYNFTSLTRLEIFKCSIPHSNFIKFGENFTSLKYLSIDKVEIISNFKQKEFTIKMINLPNTLEELIINTCSFKFNAKIPNFYELVSNSSDVILTPFDILPPINIPNLKTLKFDHIGEQEKYLRKFLSKNPQVKSILVSSYYLDQKTIDFIATNSSNLTQFAIYWDLDILSELEIPTFKYITNLTIGNIGPDSFQNAKKLINNCPNLSSLTLDFKLSGVEIKKLNKFLRTYISQLENLNQLKVLAYDFDSPQVDIYCLENINKLLIEGCDDNLLKVKVSKLPAKLSYLKIKNWETDEFFVYIK